MINMLDQAIIRYSKAQENGFDPKDFLFYPPLGKKFKRDGEKIKESFKGEDTKFIGYLSELNNVDATEIDVINNLKGELANF